VAVPSQQTKDFLKTYETVSPMVVPRSANLVAADDEFTLYAVTTFRKHSAEFIHKAREHKWIPREFKYVEGGKEEERREVERVGGDERKLWGETLRLGRTSWSEAVMVWMHVLVLRVFVETVLRYGLPLDFVCTIIRVCSFPWKNEREGLELTGADRHPERNKPTRPNGTWTRNTRTWRGMRLGATRRAGSSETTRARCSTARAASTRRMCIMNSSSISWSVGSVYTALSSGFYKEIRSIYV
jgi:V-type H+-transporting ATPase subunit C